MTQRLLLLAVFLFLAASAADAKTYCACCAEPGTYMIWTGKPDKYVIDLIKDFKFEKHSFLYMTEAGFDIIKGLSSIEKDFESDSWVATPGDFDMTTSFTGKLWTVAMKTPKGKTGTLRLPMPTQMVSYKVDIHDEDERPNGPLLYKEFRFKGTVAAGTGFVAGSIVKPTTYFLVFQGRGNGCDDAADFANWMLQVDGPRARYQFFGRLESARNNSEANGKAVRTSMPLLTLQ